MEIKENRNTEEEKKKKKKKRGWPLCYSSNCKYLTIRKCALKLINVIRTLFCCLIALLPDFQVTWFLVDWLLVVAFYHDSLHSPF